MPGLRPSSLNRNLGRAQLKGALAGETRDQELDERDANDIIHVLEALNRIRSDVNVANQGTFKTALRPRVFLESVWERRRRRGKTLSNKFAFGSLWSSAAHNLTFDGNEVRDKRHWSNKIMLEHVVPAEVVVQVVGEMIKNGMSHEPVGNSLYELFHHVVLTREDNARLSKRMSEAEIDLLVGHHTGMKPLSEEDHEKLIWSRYPDEVIRELRVPVP